MSRCKEEVDACYRSKDDVGVSHDSSFLNRFVDTFYCCILEEKETRKEETT